MTSVSPVFSSVAELDEIVRSLRCYSVLPFSVKSVPGSVLETILAEVRGGDALPTYDFVDVINRDSKVGWQVKSTMASTPVTWKRAKIPNAADLIEASKQSGDALQELGDTIIEFCNTHAQESLERYGLTAIGYSRLIVNKDRTAQYFERVLCTGEDPVVFDPEQFAWRWSDPKTAVRKEQLPSLHGFHAPTGDKWFAWHGLGENQLHFSGEKSWWPESGGHSVVFHTGFDNQVDLVSLIEMMKNAGWS